MSAFPSWRDIQGFLFNFRAGTGIIVNIQRNAWPHLILRSLSILSANVHVVASCQKLLKAR